jgi:branched-chain amino acid transport system permease protein
LENFLQQLLNGITWGGIYALIALGYTMVYGVLKLINFAHGDVYMVGAMTGFYAAHALGFAAQPSPVGLAATLAAAMVACGLLGAVIERVAYRPLRLRGAGRLAPLITRSASRCCSERASLPGADPSSSCLLGRAERCAGGAAVSNIQAAVLGTAPRLMAGPPSPW